MALPLYYNWRNLLARRFSNALTFVVVAVVVFVLALLLSFAAGIQASLVASGSSNNVIVIKPGATAESTSMLIPEEQQRLTQVQGVATGPDGSLIISAEVAVQTNLPRKGRPDSEANVAVRGLDDVGFLAHPEVRITEGRRFEQGALEVVVGKAARDRYEGLDVGDEIPLGRGGNRLYRIVGVFEARGGAIESEIWGPRTMLADSYFRTFVSSVYLRFDSPEAAAAAIAYIAGPTVKLQAKLESTYYSDLARKTREIVVLTSVLISIMAIGAVFAVANTMYAAVDGRRREIAMLRTIGFRRRAVMTSFVIESLLLCTTACLAGLAASLLFNGARQDYLSDTTWTVLAYELKVTPGIFVTALLVSATVGVVGAMAPALRAGRVRILDALRKA